MIALMILTNDRQFLGIKKDCDDISINSGMWRGKSIAPERYMVYSYMCIYTDITILFAQSAIFRTISVC